MASVKTIALLSASTLFATVSVAAMAGTSPFASKKPKAWETQGNTTAASPQTPIQIPQPSGTQYQYNTAPYTNATTQNSVPNSSNKHIQPQIDTTDPYYSPSNATKSNASGRSIRDVEGQNPSSVYSGANAAGANYELPSTNYRSSHTATDSKSSQQKNGYYPGRKPSWAGQAVPQNYTPPNTERTNTSVFKKTQSYDPNAPHQLAPQNYAQRSGAQYDKNAQYGTPSLRGSTKPSWAQRLGFGNLKATVSGQARAGIAAVRKDKKTSAESIVDLDLRAELSAITEGGLEYGAGLRARAQRDRYRRGFGGRVGDCPVTNAGCSNIVVGGNTRGVKGHTGQFYTAGNSERKETEFALEGAYLFLRSAYGDLNIGRDDGAAYLFSLGAPSLFAVGGSNSGVDYTGLDAVKTLNDASGFSEKVTYTSPRLLGDTVGVGVQFGVSYALNAKACGVNYCVRDNHLSADQAFGPELKNVIEGGVSLDRKFSNGLGVELTGTYARASEDTGNIAFDNLSSWGTGLELTYSGFVIGASYLNSNNAYAGDGNYQAYDVGMTWKPSKFGVSASYGHAKDDVAQLVSDQAVFGVSYDFNQFTIGTGVQYVNRKSPFLAGAVIEERSEDAVGLFLETGIKF